MTTAGTGEIGFLYHQILKHQYCRPVNVAKCLNDGSHRKREVRGNRMIFSRRILVIEDDENIRQVLGDFLRPERKTGALGKLERNDTGDRAKDTNEIWFDFDSLQHGQEGYERVKKPVRKGNLYKAAFAAPQFQCPQVLNTQGLKLQEIAPNGHDPNRQSCLTKFLLSTQVDRWVIGVLGSAPPARILLQIRPDLPRIE